MELTEARQKIDRVDKQLTDLFCQRMLLTAEIAAIKQRDNLSLLDETREQEILDSVGLQAGAELASYARTLYSTMLHLSKEYQQQLTQAD